MKLISFIGKGGVGKTTLAVEMANILSKDYNVLCVGLDQQHNHKDLIKMYNYDIPYKEMSNKISTMMEEFIDHTFMKGFRVYVPFVAPDFVAINSLAELLYQIKEDYDYIVIDMPPNTQGLLMLNMPSLMHNMSFKALTMKNRINRMLKGEDLALDNMDYMFKISENLKDKIKECQFNVVGIPTSLGLIESKRAYEKLIEMGYIVPRIILNMTTPPPSDVCSVCFNRHVKEKEYIEDFHKFGKEIGLKVNLIQYSLKEDGIRKRLYNIMKDFI